MFVLRAVVLFALLFLLALGGAYLATRDRKYLRIAGKTIQVPTSAPPTHLAQGAPAPAAGLYGSTAPTAPAAPAYPAATSAPPSAPPASPYPSISSSGAISAPPVPSTVPNAVPPGYPATTSYPRSAPAPSTPPYPTPSFEGSRVQFSN
mgnify:CR=1 FL=1